MSNKEFIFELTVYLKDTNIFGNVYFSRYFEWQGMAREAYFQTIKDHRRLLFSGMKLITRKASIVYENECTAFDDIVIKIQNRDIKRYSFIMVFTFFDKKTDRVIARGEQMLGFADPSGNLIMVPKEILDVINKQKVSLKDVRRGK
jgi:acyl-CoA thioesterase FadM